MHHVIIGNSAAGVYAAEAIRRSQPGDKIVILSDEKEPAYSRCLTSYYIAGKVDEQKMLIRSQTFYQDMRIEFHPGEKVMEVDPDRATVRTDTGKVIGWDRLLVASGARAVMPEIEGNNSTNVFTLRTMADARGIIESINQTREAVVVGGGLVSLKASYGLLNRGLKITVVIASGQILSQVLDGKAAGILQKHLEEHGVEFIFGDDVVEIITDQANKCRGVRLHSGAKLACGLVIIGKGVVPNTGFLEGTEIKINQGIVTDRELRTTVAGIYAAGDVAESIDYLSGKPACYAIWPTAAAQGEIAGLNMAGQKVLYEGAVAMNSLNFFGLNTICAGESRAGTPEFDVRFVYNPEEKSYQKFIFKNSMFIGYILVGNIARAGILTGMLGQRITEEDCRQLLSSGVAKVLSVK